MKLRKLDKKATYIWYLFSLITFICAAALYLLCIVNVTGVAHTPTVIVGGVICFIILVLCIIMPPLKYHYYTYSYDDKRICINRGVIFRSKIVIPVVQLQDLHIYQGPIMLLFKVSGLIVSTAGSNFIIKCMSNADAADMIEALENGLNERLKSDDYEEI